MQASSRSPSPFGSPTRTSTSSSSTSPRVSRCIRAPGSATGTLAAQLVTLGAVGGEDPDRPGIVHRLDRDTSGLLVATRSQEAFAALQDAIRRREVERRYLALVRGQAALAVGSDRRADRPRPPRSHEALHRHRGAARRGHVVRGRRDVDGARASRRASRDGANAPDSRASRGDRPSRLGRSLVRGEGRSRPRAPVPARPPPQLRSSGHERRGRVRVDAARPSSSKRSTAHEPCSRLSQAFEHGR